MPDPRLSTVAASDFHSPLGHSFAEDPNGKKIPSSERKSTCDSPCNEGNACRFYNAEHLLHRRQKSSVPPGVWTPIADVKENLAVEGQKNSSTPPLEPPSTAALLSSPPPQLHSLPDTAPESHPPHTTTPPNAPSVNPPIDAAAAREKQHRAQWAEAILHADPRGTDLLSMPAWKAEKAVAWLVLL